MVPERLPVLLKCSSAIATKTTAAAATATLLLLPLPANFDDECVYHFKSNHDALSYVVLVAKDL